MTARSSELLPCLSVPSKRCGCRVVSSACIPGASAGIRCKGGLCVGTRWLWTFSRHLRRVTAAQCWLRGPSFFIATEGKQMRRNVNSRLLTQHCADKKKAPPQHLRAISCPSCLPGGRTDIRTDSLFHGGQIKRPACPQTKGPTVHILHPGVPRLRRASSSRNTAHASVARPRKRSGGM